MALNVYQLSERVAEISRRLEAIEDHLAVVSENLGIPYAKPSAGVPLEVVELARSGDRVGAMKRYRELMNASFEEASDVVGKL